MVVMRRPARLPLLLALVASPLAAQDVPPIAQATTLPIHRGHADQMQDAERFLAAERFEAAIAILEELAGADPAELLPTADPWRFVGTSELALQRLRELPPAAHAVRLRVHGARADAAVAAALQPPDLPALERLARLHAGLPAGARARAAAAELWFDRGQPARAAWFGDARTLALRDEAAASGALPAVASLSDPALPKLRTSDLERIWSHDFSERIPAHRSAIRSRVAIGDGVIYASDGYQVSAFEAGSGRLRWEYEADPRWRSLPEADLLREAISPLLLHAPVLAEGLLLVVVHEAEPLGRSDKYSNISIRRLMPARRLVALDAATGELRWKMDAGWERGDLEPTGMAAGPPAVSAGRVYAPIFDALGTVDLRLRCLDLRTGTELWERFLASGQLETNLFGNVLIELSVPPPVADAARVVVCSHLGSYHGLDAATGAALWSRLYARAAVDSYETGRIATRRPRLARNPGVGDGVRVVWAPADGVAIEMLDAATGALLDSWPAVDSGGRSLSVLLGLTTEGVYAAGSRLALLRPGPAPDDWSEPFLEESSTPTPGRLGAMVHGGLLLPLRTASVERFGADFSYLERALDFAGEYLAAGNVQAAAGLLVVERPEGFTVFASRATFADAFADPNAGARELQQMLPVALQLQFGRDPAAAQALSQGALRLAGRADLGEAAERLRLLAARAALAAQELRRAEEVLIELLASPERGVADAAAGLLLDEIMLAEPSGRGIAAALELPRSAKDPLPLLDGSIATFAALRARARAVRAAAGDLDLDLLACLTDLLLEDPAATLRADGQPAHEWASTRLRAHLSRPDRRADYEEAARAILRERPCDASLLRAFGPTASMQDALQRETMRTDLSRAERLERQRWRREYGDPQRVWPDLETWFPPPAALARLPSALRAVTMMRGSNLLPLALADRGSTGARAWLKYEDGLALASFTRGGVTTEADFPRKYGLVDQAIATPEGCAAFAGDLILHFSPDGAARALPLPGRIQFGQSPLDLGAGLVAMTLTGVGEFLRLAVVDACTGVPYLIEDLPGDPTNATILRRDGRWLYLFEARAPRAYRVDLHFRAPPLAFSLPTGIDQTDLHAISVEGGEVWMLDNRQRGRGVVLRAGPGVAPLELPFDGALLRRLRAQPGFAWSVQPAQRDTLAAPVRELHWLLPREDVPRVVTLTGEELRFLTWLHSDPRRNPGAAPDQVLALRAGPSERAELVALGPAPVPAWMLPLEPSTWSELQAAQPQPRRVDRGWIVPLLLRATQSTPQRLWLLAVDDAGQIRAQTLADLRGGGAEQIRVEPVDGGVLLRDGNTVTLYGEF